MEKSNVYSLMTRLKNQSHLRVPATAEKPQKVKLQPVQIQVTPSILKRVQTPAVIKAGQIKINHPTNDNTNDKQNRMTSPLNHHLNPSSYTHTPTYLPTSLPAGIEEPTDPALITLQDDFKELTELQRRLHFMLKDLESILESEKES